MTDATLELDFRAQVRAANPFVIGPHQQTDDPGWQESVFLCWHDRSAGVGGFQRIGFEPNRGTCNQQTAAYSSDGTRFRSVNHLLPYRAADRGREAFHANGTTCRFEGDSETRWIVDHGDDYRCNLLLTDIYPYTPMYATEHGRARDWAVDSEEADGFVPAHWETSARIRGELTLAGRDYHIDGFAHRDQSFGFRDWKIIRSHRAFVGTFGEAFNFSILSWHTNTDAYAGYGMVLRDGVEEWTDDVELVTQMAADGVTVYGGQATLRMPSGEVIVIDAKAHASIMLSNYEYFGVDTNCQVSVGGLSGGYGDFEVSNNPYDGRRYPTFAIGTTLENGLFLP
ncbi:hypothetical protein [Mycobacterium sp. E1747]|uniref:DUF7065 domain-containing protein n=1 Tax=Mycobacterium sp. E1747 TaxID=1834128 RepID=UPI0008021D9A|nr:hypothetical protein [Mycobacterium sp. E1747]OBH11163.1 hypothetical protein A5695_20365 [Mycobacterium sp. E1747]